MGPLSETDGGNSIDDNKEPIENFSNGDSIGVGSAGLGALVVVVVDDKTLTAEVARRIRENQCLPSNSFYIKAAST